MYGFLMAAIGGAVGASLRYGVGLSARALLGAGYPWGTLIVNVLGSALMGLGFVWLTARGFDRYAPLLLVGMLGGFTTFSAFSLELWLMIGEGRALTALGYVLVSVAASLGALMLGVAAARALVAG